MMTQDPSKRALGKPKVGAVVGSPVFEVNGRVWREFKFEVTKIV